MIFRAIENLQCQNLCHRFIALLYFFILPDCRMKTLSLLFLLSLATYEVVGVDRNNFKTCEQSGFCKRLRAYRPGQLRYVLNFDTVIAEGHSLTAEVLYIDEEKNILVSLLFYSTYFNIKYSIVCYNLNFLGRYRLTKLNITGLDTHCFCHVLIQYFMIINTCVPC